MYVYVCDVVWCVQYMRVQQMNFDSIQLHTASMYYSFPVDPKPLPKRNSLPVTRHHATSVLNPLPDSMPKTVDTDDLVDSIDFKERGIDVTFPPTPPSTSASERGGAVVQPQSDTSLQSVPDVDVAETSIEQYKKLSAVQSTLQGSSLRASGRRRYRSHLLQYNSNQDLSDQPHFSYVLPTESPTGPTGYVRVLIS